MPIVLAAQLSGRCVLTSRILKNKARKQGSLGKALSVSVYVEQSVSVRAVFPGQPRGEKKKEKLSSLSASLAARPRKFVPQKLRDVCCLRSNESESRGRQKRAGSCCLCRRMSAIFQSSFLQHGSTNRLFTVCQL